MGSIWGAHLAWGQWRSRRKPKPRLQTLWLFSYIRQFVSSFICIRPSGCLRVYSCVCPCVSVCVPVCMPVCMAVCPCVCSSGACVCPCVQVYQSALPSLYFPLSINLSMCCVCLSYRQYVFMHVLLPLFICVSVCWYYCWAIYNVLHVHCSYPPAYVTVVYSHFA